jgi:hypothetical protein
MSTQVLEKPASERQRAYIKRLQGEIGEERPVVSEEISSAEASTIISDLVAKAQKRNGTNAQTKINEPRLGMAMKECFRDWRRMGWDIFRDDERKKRFMNEVIETYGLFTEIVERVAQNNKSDN